MFKILAAAALLGLAALPAAAADLAATPTVADVAPASFSWEGGYVGGYLGAYPDYGSATTGAELGYNFVLNSNILLGLEGSALYYLDGSNDTEFFIHGKAGVVIDKVALYATSGVGTYDFGTDTLWDIGLGIEVAVTDHLTVDAQIFGRNVIGTAPDDPHVQVGMRYHF